MSQSVLADVLSLSVYAVCLYMPALTWVATGLHMAMQYGTQRVTQRVVVLSVLQVARCSDSLRTAVHSVRVAMSAAGLVVAILARLGTLKHLSKRVQGMFVLCFYTLIVAVRVDVSNEFRMLRAVMYMLLHYTVDPTATPWERAAMCTWVLGSFNPLLMCLAAVQLVVDGNVLVLLRSRAQKRSLHAWSCTAVRVAVVHAYTAFAAPTGRHRRWH